MDPTRESIPILRLKRQKDMRMKELIVNFQDENSYQPYSYLNCIVSSSRLVGNDEYTFSFASKLCSSPMVFHIISMVFTNYNKQIINKTVKPF